MPQPHGNVTLICQVFPGDHLVVARFVKQRWRIATFRQETAMTEPANSRPRLIIPRLGSLYAALHESAETLLRVAAGALLARRGNLLESRMKSPFLVSMRRWPLISTMEMLA